MRVCPKCGYADMPIWRHKRHRMFTCYCRLDELKDWDKELAELIETKKDVKLLGYVYHLTKSGYVDRIHESDSLNAQSWREPDQEKHKCRFLTPNQTLLFTLSSEQTPKKENQK